MATEIRESRVRTASSTGEGTRKSARIASGVTLRSRASAAEAADRDRLIRPYPEFPRDRLSRPAESRGSRSDRGPAAKDARGGEAAQIQVGVPTSHAPKLRLPRAAVKARRAADRRIASPKPAPAPATGSSNRPGALRVRRRRSPRGGGAGCLRLLRRRLRVDTEGAHEGLVRRLSSQRGCVKESAGVSAGGAEARHRREIEARGRIEWGWLVAPVDLVRLQSGRRSAAR